jgi:hypothetical protein
VSSSAVAMMPSFPEVAPGGARALPRAMGSRSLPVRSVQDCTRDCQESVEGIFRR